MREANSDNNLSLVQSSMIENATKPEDLDGFKDLIYKVPIIKEKYEGGDEPFTMVKMLVASFEKLERTVEMEAYINKIYDEYFDNRTYLIE